VSLGLRCARQGNHNHADQNKKGADNGAQAERFAAKKIANQHGNHRIHVCVCAHLGRRLMVEQPDVRREPDDRSKNNQIKKRQPRCWGDCEGMEGAKLPEGSSREKEHDAAGEHLGAGTHHL